MARIEWQPLAIPDIGDSALRAQQASANSIRGAFQDLSGVLDQWKGQRREENRTELYRRQNRFASGAVGPDGRPTGIPDVAGYVSDLADGDLINNLGYLTADDIAAARSYTNELRSGRTSEETRNRGIVVQGREDQAYTRGQDDLASGVIVAREANRIETAVRNGTMTPAEGAAAAAQLATLTNNAGQINAAFDSVEQGIEGNRGNVRWNREGENYDRTRTQWNWQVQDRDTEQAASALALQFQEFGPNTTNVDMMASDAYQNASPRVRARALALLGREAPLADVTAGAPSSSTLSGEAPVSSIEEYVNRTFAAESGGTRNPNTARPVDSNGRLLSSAVGAGQFIESTWLSTMRRYAPNEVRGKTDAQILAMRSDPALMRRMTIAHTRENEQVLQAAGVPINDATRYAAHFLGSAGAVSLYTADRNAPITSAVNARAIAANPGVFRPRRGPAITTVGQLQDVLLSKMGGTAPTQSRAAAQTLQVGASVAAGTDRYGSLARNVIPLMNDDRDNITVANELTNAEGGKFAGLNAREVAIRIRSIQEMYAAQSGGGVLSAAAAGQILANNMDPYTVGDFVGGFFGRRGSIGRGGAFPTQSISVNGVREDLAQLRPQPVLDRATGRPIVVNGVVQTEIPLATHYRNQSNREEIIAGSAAIANALTQAQTRLQQQEAYDERMGISNNPTTLNLRRQVLQLEQQREVFNNSAVGQLQAAGQVSQPAARPAAPVRTPVRRNVVPTVSGD